MTNGQVEDMYDYKQPRRKQLPILPDRTHPYQDQVSFPKRYSSYQLNWNAKQLL